MSFLNLGLGELLGLGRRDLRRRGGAVSARPLQAPSVVATLRFWSAADVRTELKHRRRIQQPWSLLLQLTQPGAAADRHRRPATGHLRRRRARSRDRARYVRLDGRRASAAGNLMDQAKANRARAYLRSVPRRDRVMLVRADALATPATAFESSRGVAGRRFSNRSRVLRR